MSHQERRLWAGEIARLNGQINEAAMKRLAERKAEQQQ